MSPADQTGGGPHRRGPVRIPAGGARGVRHRYGAETPSALTFAAANAAGRRVDRV
jgi:hypothetical protein